MSTPLAELDAARDVAIDASGWGRRFVFYQPRNLAFWGYLLLVMLGVYLFAQVIAKQYPAFGQAITLAVTLLIPYGALFWWFTQRIDRYAKLPAKLMVAAFVWGGFAATWAMAASANDAARSLYAKVFGQTWALNWGAGLTAPFTEELAKGAGLLMLITLAPRVIRTAFDGFILGAFIGLGFQLLEDVAYATTAAGSRFGADQIELSLTTVWLRMFSGVAAHILYSAIFCAGLVYLLGGPAEPRRVGRGLLLIAIPVVLHGVWNSLQVFAGSNPVAQLALLFGVTVVALAIVAWVFSLTVARERELMRVVMAPEVARGVINEIELATIAGNRKARKRFRKSIPSRSGRRQGGYVLNAARDLAAELAASRGAESDRVAFARAEVDRIRYGAPPDW